MGVSYKHEANKDHLLNKGMEILWTNGYNGTSVGNIVKAAGVPKGSFYNYFESKEDFVIQALDKYFSEMFPHALKIIEDPQLPGKEKMYQLYSFKVKMALSELEHKMGCMALNLGNEMSDHSEAIRKAIVEKESFVKNKVVDIVREGQKRGEIKTELSAESMVDFIDDAWKGAMVTAKEYRSDEPLNNFLEVLQKVIL